MAAILTQGHEDENVNVRDLKATLQKFKNDHIGIFGTKTGATYTAEEATAYNTAHGYEQGDEGYVSAGDPKSYDNVKDYVDNKLGGKADSPTYTQVSGKSYYSMTI